MSIFGSDISQKITAGITGPIWASEIGGVSPFSPLSLNPLLAFDSNRMLNFSSSSPIVRVRRETEGDEVDIYGFNPLNPIQYQTSAGGAYVTTASLLFPSERFYIVTYYDQSGNSYNATQATASTQPELFWEGATFGSDIVVNGGFDTDTDWTKAANWSISGGVASADELISAGNITQTILTTDAIYQTQWDMVSTDGGAFLLVGWRSATLDMTLFGLTNSVGTKILIEKATGVTFGFRGSGAFTGSIDNVSVKEVLTWKYPVIKPDGVDDNLGITVTNAASDYSLFIRTKQADTTETFDYILDIQTGALRFAYPADSADTAGYYDSAWRTAALTDADWANITMVLQATASGAIYNENISIGSSLSYAQTAIGGTVKIFSDISGANNYGGMIKCLILFPSALSTDDIANLVTYYS